AVAYTNDGVERRAHATAGLALSPEAIDVSARLLEGIDDGRERGVAGGLPWLVPEAREGRLSGEQALVHRRDGGLRRDLAAVVTAHAVGQQEEAIRLVESNGVLVPL